MTSNELGIACRGLRKVYGETVALVRLDLTVAAGEIVCLLGANGAGKTTTLQLLLGFTMPTEGTALVDGIDVAREPEAARARVGYLPEVVELYPHFTGLEVLRYFDELGGRRWDAAAHEAALTETGLPRDAHTRRVATYSKGMRQKLGLAIALGKGARTLLLDEPLSGLDPTAANELVSLLRGLKAKRIALLAVTHDIFRAHQIADRIGIMRRGQLVEVVEPSALTAAETERVYVDHLRDVS